MKKLKIYLVLLAVFLVPFPVNAQISNGNGRAASVQETPEKWLIQKSREFLTVLSVQEIKSRYLKLRRFCKEVFNQQEMTKLAMGKYWKEMSPRQQEELQRLFFDYFVVTYGTLSFNFSNVSLQVTETVPVRNDLLMKVQAKLGQNAEQMSAKPQNGTDPIANLPNEGAFEILFSLRPRAGGYYIRDAKFEGQSILMFLRSHLEKEYKNADFNMENLLAGLRKKINDRYRAAEDLAKKNTAKK